MSAAHETATDLFDGPGEMPGLCREKDWSGTPLGPRGSWSPVLRSTVRTMLASPFPACLWCGEELVLVYNDGYREVLAAKHPEALGRSGYEVWNEVWDQLAPLFERMRAGGPPVYAEDASFYLERSGEVDAPSDRSEPNAWFTFSLSPVRDEGGSIVAFLNIAHETTGQILTERERAEAQARAERAERRLLDVFERAPAFMAILRGPDHLFEYANQAYYELVGERDLIGRPAFEALPEARDQGFEELLGEVYETGEAFVGREVPIELRSDPDAEAEQRYLDFVYYPVEEPSGSVSGVVAHGYDVTEHVRSRKAAERARAEAEEANEAKSRFLGTMSHELRTPINAIMGYAELLDEEISGTLNEAQHTQLGGVRSSARHLHMLIGDILDLSHVEAGEVELDRQTARTADAVSDALSLVRPQAREQGLELESRCTDGDSPRYLGDENRVRQILVNLLTNAVEFTPSGGTIRVTCGTARPAALDRDMTWVRVTDTGVGIPSDEVEEIFQPFRQPETAMDAARSGTGLGLSVSRQLAELMGGRLTVESEPGEGSTFTLWMPGPPTATSA